MNKEILKEKMFIDSNKILNKNLNAIDFQGLEIFKKEANLLNSTIFGIPLKYLGIAAFIIFLIKRR